MLGRPCFNSALQRARDFARSSAKPQSETAPIGNVSIGVERPSLVTENLRVGTEGNPLNPAAESLFQTSVRIAPERVDPAYRVLTERLMNHPDFQAWTGGRAIFGGSDAVAKILTGMQVRPNPNGNPVIEVNMVWRGEINGFANWIFDITNVPIPGFRGRPAMTVDFQINGESGYNLATIARNFQNGSPYAGLGHPGNMMPKYWVSEIRPDGSLNMYFATPQAARAFANYQIETLASLQDLTYPQWENAVRGDRMLAGPNGENIGATNASTLEYVLTTVARYQALNSNFRLGTGADAFIRSMVRNGMTASQVEGALETARRNISSANSPTSAAEMIKLESLINSLVTPNVQGQAAPAPSKGPSCEVSKPAGQ